MNETPIKIKVENVKLITGNYEGHDYYQIKAETDAGIILKGRLTKFEYNVIKENYA